MLFAIRVASVLNVIIQLVQLALWCQYSPPLFLLDDARLI